MFFCAPCFTPIPCLYFCNLYVLLHIEHIIYKIRLWQLKMAIYSEYWIQYEFHDYLLYSFYRAMHFRAKRGIAIACRLSVCLSVTLVNCDHIG